MKRYYLLTLGCPKNAVDSEGMSGILASQGLSQVQQPEDADVLIVNTCSFIAAAREETLGVLRELGAAKQPHQQLIAAGCMAQSHPGLLQAVPGVDATLSTREWMQIGTLLEPAADSAANALHIPLLVQPAANSAVQPQQTGYADWRTTQIRRSNGGPSAYLKISDGCNLRCAFCTIPSFKGDMRSKPVGAVLAEARDLAELGVGEIILVAQHLTDYGRDLGLQDGLATLLSELCDLLPQQTWLRLMYAYPHGVTPRLIEVMASRPQICAYLDMPLQHAHPATLRRMRRPPDTERTRTLITSLREAMPDIAIRSTFIVGFPGETGVEFQALLDFLSDMQLDRVGAFRYSREPGTPAAGLPEQVHPRLIERRWHELMQLQQQISLQRNRRWQGRVIEMLVEGQGQSDAGRPLLVGRSFRDAPEIDGQVFCWGSAAVGSKLAVQITNVAEYDLWGIPAPASASPAG